MKIKLMVGGTEKLYVSPFISGRIFRNAIKMQNMVQNISLSEELLDELVSFVVDVFGKQFTIDEFYDGIESDKMFDEILNILMCCINGTNGMTEKH